MRAAVGLLAGAVASVCLVILLSGEARERTELVFKWGPPTLQPKLAQEDKWGPPKLKSEHSPQTILAAAGTRDKARHQDIKLKGPGGRELDINVNVKQDHNNDVKMAPVDLEIVMPDAKAHDHDQKQAVAHAVSVAPRMARTAAAMPVVQTAGPFFSQQQLALREEQQQELAEHVAQARAEAEQRRARAEKFEKLQKEESRVMKAAHLISLAEEPTPTTDLVKNMYSAQQLMSLEDALKEQARDARDNAFTQTGVDRAHELERQAKEVEHRLQRLPELLAKKLKKASKEGEDAEIEIATEKRKLSRAEAQLKKEQKIEGPRKVRNEARSLQAKVELERAAADALADVMGKPAPRFHHLEKPESAIPPGPPISSLQDKVKKIKQKLQTAQHALERSTARHSVLAQDILKAEHHDSRSEIERMYGAAMKARETMLSMPSPDGLHTIEPQFGAHVVKTPKKVQKMANVTKGPTKEGPKVQWCKWGTEMVPCAPGYGGAWLEHHIEDRGIWPKEQPAKIPPHLRAHVKAGERSKTYMDDMFGYGEAGIFGAKSQGPRVFKGRMLAGGHTNDKPKDASHVPLHELIQKALMADARKHNIHSPEWTDHVLNQAKKRYHFMVTHMDYSDFPDKKAPKDKWGSEVHGIIDPNLQDDIMDEGRKKYTESHKDTDHSKDPWGSSVHGIIDPNIQDTITAEGKSKYAESHKDVDHSKDNWGSSVHGIIDPNLQDTITAEGKSKYAESHKDVDHSKDNWGSSVHVIIDPNLQDTITAEGKGKYAASHKETGSEDKGRWGSTVHGIVDPNLIDHILNTEAARGKVSGAKGVDSQALKGASGSKDRAVDGQRGRGLQAALQRDKQAQLRSLERLADVE